MGQERTVTVPMCCPRAWTGGGEDHREPGRGSRSRRARGGGDPSARCKPPGAPRRNGGNPPCPAARLELGGTRPAAGRHCLMRALSPRSGPQGTDGHPDGRRRGGSRRAQPGVRSVTRPRDLGGGRRGAGDGRLGRGRWIRRAAGRGRTRDGDHPVYRHRRLHGSRAKGGGRGLEAHRGHARRRRPHRAGPLRRPRGGDRWGFVSRRVRRRRARDPLRTGPRSSPGGHPGLHPRRCSQRGGGAVRFACPGRGRPRCRSHRGRGGVGRGARVRYRARPSRGSGGAGVRVPRAIPPQGSGAGARVVRRGIIGRLTVTAGTQPNQSEREGGIRRAGGDFWWHGTWHGNRPWEDKHCGPRHRATVAGAAAQRTAFFTSAPIFASSFGVSSFSAKEVGHMAPLSRFAASSKPNVAYLELNFPALLKKQTTLPSFAYAGIPYQVFGQRAGALAVTIAWSRLAMARSDPFIAAIAASTSRSPSARFLLARSSAFSSWARAFIAARSSPVNPLADFFVSFLAGFLAGIDHLLDAVSCEIVPRLQRPRKCARIALTMVSQSARST